MNTNRRKLAYLAFFATTGLMTTACVSERYATGYPRILYDDQEFRAQYEEEFATRELDPLEGFWQSSNEFAEGEAVVCRVEPSVNSGFPIAAFAVRQQLNLHLPYRFPSSRQIVGRWKPTSGRRQYNGQILLVRGQQMYWQSASGRLIDATTFEVTVGGSPVLGGNVQRGYLVGPPDLLAKRLAMVEKAKQRQEDPSAVEAKPGASTGSGFLIASDLVVTSFHIVSDHVTIRCATDFWSSEATIVAEDKNTDLALLFLKNPAPPEVPIFPIGVASDMRQGERVFAMGFPLTDVLGEGLRVHEGIISSLTGIEGSAREFQIEMSLNPGNSGGPLLNGAGQAIGIVVRKLSLGYALKTGILPEGVTFAVKSDHLLSLLGASGRMASARFEKTGAEHRTLDQLVETYGRSVVRVTGE